VTRNGQDGTSFAVWAPGAARVSVVGEWNGWTDRHSLRLRGQSGLFEGFVPGVGPGAVYKYHVASRLGGYEVDKADRLPPRDAPRTGSVVWKLDYEWGDAQWMNNRKRSNALDAPWSVYEVHLGSWRDPGTRPHLTCRSSPPRSPTTWRDALKTPAP
jgi:1,4-alpha-glucan branching enzyme